MSNETSTGTKTNYSIVGLTGTKPGTYLQIPLEVNAKGLKKFTIILDEMELDQTGTKTIDGKLVSFMTFKIVK